ncbi:MAG: flavin reductase family protein [Planctomycetes bacterium]|nr:flavin reductase family protein [Planctomycetota bacterium]
MVEENPVLMREIQRAFHKLTHGGLLVTSIGENGRPNVMTIGWWLFGWFYHGRPMSVIAIRPATHTFKLLAEVPEYVVSVPTDDIAEVVAICGRESGRDMDKFAECHLTAIPSKEVRPPSIRESTLNIECRIYHPQAPPHMILTPEHRRKPVPEQHTIYFSEVLAAWSP